MNEKTLQYARLMAETSENIVGSREQWTGYLSTAARLYKYDYHEQVLIYAQRPDATACASYDLWNNRMGRYVKLGAKGIALVDISGDEPRLRYVFDVADTGTRESSRPVNLWQMQNDYLPVVGKSLCKRFVSSDTFLTFDDALLSASSRMAAEYWNEHQGELVDILAQTRMMGYSLDEARGIFRRAALNSVLYTVYDRCFGNAESYFEPDDFVDVTDFNTLDAATALGTAVNEMSGQILREIERTIRRYEREQAERSQNHDGVELHTERGLSYPEPRIEPDQNRTAGQVWEDAPDISGREQADYVQSPDSDGATVPALGGDRPAEPRESGFSDAAVPNARPAAEQSGEPDGLGAAHEQSESAGRGSSDAGDNLQLSFFPSEAAQIQSIDRKVESRAPSAFTFPQAEIERALQQGSGIEDGKMRIYAMYQQQMSHAERAKAIKKEYGIGGWSYKFLDGNSGFLDHDAKGITLRDSTEYRSQVLRWSAVERGIAKLINDDKYLTEGEKEQLEATTQQDTVQSKLVFEYQGCHFEPIGILPSNTNYNDAERHIRSHVEPRMSNYGGGDIPYSYQGFYDASGSSKADVFRCIETGGLYIPGTNELFGYNGEFEPYIEATIEKQSESISAQEHQLKAERDTAEDETIVEVTHPTEELTVLQKRANDIAKQYEDLSLDEKVSIIAQAFGASSGTIETSPCTGDWRGTSDVSIRFDNGHSLFIGNRLTPKAKTQKAQHEMLNSKLVLYNPQIIAETKENATAFLQDREVKDSAIAAEKGLKPYRLLNVEFYDGTEGKDDGYMGWYYVTLAVDGKILPLMETGLNREIMIGQLDSSRADRPYRVAGAVEESKVDFVFGNVGFSSGSGLYTLPLSNAALERAEKTLAELTNDDALKIVPADASSAAPDYTSEAVASYPAEENNLPYDVEIQTLHFNEPAQEQVEPIENTIATVEVQPPAENFRITDMRLGYGTPGEKFAANTAAIQLLKTLEYENRPATKDEQITLSRYVGWGGLADCFDEKSSHYPLLKSLLSEDEFAAARASTLNAHYTGPTVIHAIYDAVEQMGFKSGNILEPSMGVGNFFGMLPESMSSSKLYGVELDSITGRIAQKLYPNADITVAGFETTDRRDFYDLAVGNVPFGNYKVNDKPYNKLGFSIHNYFFAKALDQVRPGGVVAFVTSRYTMDAKDPSARKYIAQHAELIGAIRLPNNAFKANAGTEVVSDILFLQKRDRPIDIEPDWVHLGQTEGGFAINSYFVDHPEMVLGTLTAESTQYGREDCTVEPIEGAHLDEQLAEAITHIEGHYQEAEITADDLSENQPDTIPADPNVRNFSYAVLDGEVYYRENSIMRHESLNDTAKARIVGMVNLRSIVNDLIEFQLNDYPETAITTKQQELNAAYDAFYAKYGTISSRPNGRVFEDDSSYYLLCSLENVDEDYNLISKADMFTKRTIRPDRKVTNVDTPSEALAISIGERGCVDLPFMANLLGKQGQFEEIVSELSGVIFRDPLEANANDYTKGWHTADDYLSGNVRSKLEIARRWAVTEPSLAANVEALEKAQPKELEASEIDVHLGAPWVDAEYIHRFMRETFETPFYTARTMKVNYAKVTGEWQITNKSSISQYDISAYETYGTQRMSAYRILEDTLNLRDVRVYDTVEDADGKQKRVLNKKETTLAQQKQQKIKDAFKDWIWKDPTRRHDLVQKYNVLFNSTRPREYDGSHIHFVGMTPDIKLREHQRNAIAHVLYGGNTLLAHEVGAGKTFEMAAAAMESKRLGLCQKSLFVVPNHLTLQWANEFLRLYPSAKLLVANKKDFETANRKKFCARIATGDYDAVIIGHSQFEKIPISAERQERILNNQIADIEAGIKELKDSHGERFTIKQMEKTRKNLEAKLEKLTDTERKDDVITFEQLGVDRLFVDESHSYKNLFLYTKMRNVAGLSTSEAQKSSDMFAKCQYMDELTGGRGIVFATGTPVSNSMTELYTVMRYLQYNTLRQKDMTHFDSWAASFGETVTAIELSPEGTGYRARTRFSRFSNLPELMNMFKEVADIKTSDQLHLPVPEAKFETVVAQPSEHQTEMVKSLSERAAAVHAGSVDASVDNMLKITSDGRKIGLDQRLMNPLLPDDPNSKVNACVRNVLKIWEDGKEDKLTQLLFCDMSTPKDDGTFNVYDDIRSKLIVAGVPESEVAFIHNADTDAKKKELFGKVRSGEVRVLLGSTQKMGAGTNVQDRLVAVHHLDVGWRPADMTQRNGRIIRQGNRNKQVFVYNYVTEKTFDAYLFQTLENKQKFISQVMTSKTPLRSCEDVDEQALSYAEIKALCAGDPQIKEKMDLDVEVARLKVLKSDHQSQKYRLEDKLLKYFPIEITRVQGYIKCLEADVKSVADNPQPKDDFVGMEVKGVHFDKKEDAGLAILAACKQLKTADAVPIGSYRGFGMKLEYNNFAQTMVIILKAAAEHCVPIGTDARGNVQRLDNALNAIPERLEQAKNQLENLRQQQAAAEVEVTKPFPQEEELAAKSARLVELNALLDLDAQGHGEQKQGEAEQPEQAAEKGGSVLADLHEKAAQTPPPVSRPHDCEVAL